MGKWSYLKGTLEQAPVEPSHQQKVDAEKAKYNGADMKDMGTSYNKLRVQKNELNDQLALVNIKLDAVQQLLIRKFEQDGVDKLRMTDGSTLSLDDQPYCGVQDKQAFLKWVRDTGQDDLLTVHYQTMSSMVKDLMTEGKAPPPGIKAWIKTSIKRWNAR